VFRFQLSNLEIRLGAVTAKRKSVLQLDAPQLQGLEEVGRHGDGVLRFFGGGSAMS